MKKTLITLSLFAMLLGSYTVVRTIHNNESPLPLQAYQVTEELSEKELVSSKAVDYWLSTLTAEEENSVEDDLLVEEKMPTTSAVDVEENSKLDDSELSESILNETNNQQLALLPAAEIDANGAYRKADGKPVTWDEAEDYVDAFEIPDYILQRFIEHELSDDNDHYDPALAEEEFWAVDGDSLLRIHAGLAPEERLRFEKALMDKYEGQVAQHKARYSLQ